MSTQGITKGITDTLTVKSHAQSNFNPSKIFGSKLSLEQNPFEHFNGTCSGTMIMNEDIGGTSLGYFQTDPDSHTMHQSYVKSDSCDSVNAKVNKTSQCLPVNEKIDSNKSITLLQDVHQKSNMKGQELNSQRTKASKGCLKSGKHQCPNPPRFSDPALPGGVKCGNGNLGVTGVANDQKMRKQSFADTETSKVQRKTEMSKTSDLESIVSGTDQFGKDRETKRSNVAANTLLSPNIRNLPQGNQVLFNQSTKEVFFNYKEKSWREDYHDAKIIGEGKKIFLN